MEQYLVTGGAGFIGSHIAQALVHRQKRVRVLDNFLTGKKENVAEFLADIELLEGDIQDLETCRRAVRDVGCILHQAALPSVPRSISDPLTTNEINITGTLNILIAAREARVDKIVFASSSSTYGADTRLPKREGNEGRPLSPYAVSKHAGEDYCRLFGDLFGMATISLRYFNVFGPRQDPSSQYSAVIPLFITKVLRGESPAVFGNGEQSRDFTYVENVVEANILASEASIPKSDVMNIACGERITINSLLDSINRILGTNIAAAYAKERPGDIMHSFADISKAKRVLGYVPRVSFQEGLEKTIAWYEQNR
jgi:UDP-glucose 4-epimerase